jgi:hypothetical protein
MAGAAKVIRSFVYIADKHPVLVFENEKDAHEFEKIFKGAEIYGQKSHVFLPTPHGLDFVTGGKGGEMAYSKWKFMMVPLLSCSILLNHEKLSITATKPLTGSQSSRAMEQCIRTVILPKEPCFWVEKVMDILMMDYLFGPV